LLYKEPNSLYTGLYKTEEQDHDMEKLLDWKLLEVAQPALQKYSPRVSASFKIVNTDRAAGTILSNEISKKYASEGLPE
jgi:glutamate synthase (NADPH/NADH) large chain